VAAEGRDGGDRLRRLGVAAAAGFAFHLAYPRPGWDLLGWVGLVPVLWLAATARTPGRAFGEAWVAGVACFVPLLRWLTDTMSRFSTLPWPVAVLVLGVLAAYLALYWGAVAWLVAALRPAIGARALWLAPAFWVTAELARTHVLSGCPWGLVGYVPYRRLGIIQVAAWTGVYGVSALLVLVNAALGWAVLRRTRRAALASAAVAALSLGGALGLDAGVAPGSATPGVRVGLVQGNIDQAIKWNRTHQDATLRTYERLTREAAAEHQLVVWPEAAVPAYLRDESWVLDWLSALARAVERPLLVGAPDAAGDPGGTTRYLNSALLIDGRGIAARYDKMHLVPFGEYVPLRRLLFFVEAIATEIGDFTPGRETVIFPWGGAPFGTVICYEVIFPDLVRRFVSKGARFVVNITNDAWFGDSSGPLQHLAMVPLRAVENGTAIVRSANTGVSALVSPRGEIGPTLGLFQRGVLSVDVPLAHRQTFYTRYGDLFAYAMCAVTTVALGSGILARRRS
jgi:apolipoprotein N-acyltransferase